MTKQNAIVRFFCKLSKDHLLLLQALQTGTLMGASDLIAQTMVEKKPLEEVNFVRTAQFASLGFVVVGPVLGTWYKVLAGTVKPDKLVGVKKMLLDQLCFAPCFLAAFLTILNLLEGHDLEYAKKQLDEKYKDILITNYKIWPAVQLFNFYVMPLTHQVLVAQIAALFWNTYLSWKSSQGKQQ